MRTHSRQAGFTLSNLIILGLVLVFCIVYGRGIGSIYYHSKQVATILKSVAASEKTEADARKKFSDMLAFERISDAVPANDLEVAQSGDALSLAITYKECSTLAGKWEVCSTFTLSSDK